MATIRQASAYGIESYRLAPIYFHKEDAGLEPEGVARLATYHGTVRGMMHWLGEILRIAREKGWE